MVQNTKENGVKARMFAHNNICNCDSCVQGKRMEWVFTHSLEAKAPMKENGEMERLMESVNLLALLAKRWDPFFIFPRNP